jgi:hypothetical protein
MSQDISLLATFDISEGKLRDVEEVVAKSAGRVPAAPRLRDADQLHDVPSCQRVSSWRRLVIRCGAHGLDGWLCSLMALPRADLRV